METSTIKKKGIQKKPEACNVIKKQTLAQVFSCEFCEISKNTFFTEQLWWLLLLLMKTRLRVFNIF